MNSVRSFQIPFGILNSCHLRWTDLSSDVYVDKDESPEL